MAEEIYEPSVPYLQGKIVRHKVQNLEPIIILNVSNSIIYRYNKFTLCCYLMHINVIKFMNTISLHIIFATVIMVKNRKMRKIEDVIKHANKLYLYRGFKISHIHSDIKV